MEPHALDPLFAPRAIVIIGDSESPDSWAREIHLNLRRFGFEGPIHSVNPKYERLWDGPCLPSARDLPPGIDLAVVAVPATIAVEAVEEAAAAGVRAAMVVSSGFGEIGEEGRQREARLGEVGRRCGIPVLGPNVEGFLNYGERVAPYGAVLPPEPEVGGVTVVSGSGTVVWSMVHMASDRGAGMRVAVGVGNEAGVRIGDLLAWAAADPDTEVVACYAEALRDLSAMERGLVALAKAGKPTIVCAPAVRGEAARRSVLAHTGALAGDTGIRDTWLRRRGALMVHDPVELFEAAVLLSARRRVRARGAAAAMQSGGACTLFAEAAEREGLDLPSLRSDTEARLAEVLPAFANPTNPLDVTGQAPFVPEIYQGALSALAADGRLGLIVLDAAPPRSGDDMNWADPILGHVRDLEAREGVAVASVLMTPLSYSPDAKAFVARSGVPFLQGHGPAAAALRCLIDFQEVGLPPAGREASAPPEAHALLRGKTGSLDEVAAGRLLEAYGFARPPEEVVAMPEEAVSALARVGAPVAVKAAAPEIPHKARVGALRLGLSEPGEARFVTAPLAPGEARRTVQREASRLALDPTSEKVRVLARALEAMGLLAYELRRAVTEVEVNPFVLQDDAGVAVDALVVARGDRAAGH